MAKDLELMLEELYYKSDGIIGKKLLDQIILEATIQKNLEESSGILSRKVGSLYTVNNKKYELIVAKTLPEAGGAYATKEELKTELDKKISEFSVKSIIASVGNPEDKSLIYAFFKESGKTDVIGIIRYYKNVQMASKWTDSEIAKTTGLVRFKASGALVASQVQSIKLKPSDLVGNEEAYTFADLRKLVETNATNISKNPQDLPQICVTHIKDMFASASSGGPMPILSGGAPYEGPYGIYLGEIFAPVSVVLNWNSVGAKKSAQDAIIPGENFASCKIKFREDVTGGLYDSVLVSPSNKEVLISSKAKAGAAASVTTLLEDFNFLENLTEKTIEQMQKSDKYKEFKKNYSRFIEVIQVVIDNNQWNGPLVLALQYKIIDQLMYNFMTSIQDLRAAPKIIFDTKIQERKQIAINKKMEKFAKESNYVPRSMERAKPALYYLAAIASEVAEKMNEDKKLKFNEAVRICLNSSLIQVNANTGKSGNNCFFKPFVVTYPPKFTGTIIVDASKNYSATELKGKLCFKIPVSSDTIDSET